MQEIEILLLEPLSFVLYVRHSGCQLRDLFRRDVKGGDSSHGIFRDDFSKGSKRWEERGGNALFPFSVPDELQRVSHSLPLIFPGCQLPKATTSSPSYNAFHFGPRFSCLCLDARACRCRACISDAAIILTRLTRFWY